MTPADEAMEMLHEHGWSVGDIAFVMNGERQWLVFCQRSDEQIRITAPTSREAWERAAALALANEKLISAHP